MRGYVLSFDALIALVLVMAAVLLLQNVYTQGAPVPFEHLKSATDSTFEVLDREGFYLEQVDANSLDDAARSVYLHARSRLPENAGVEVTLREFTLDRQACRAGRDFESCFGHTPVDVSVFGDTPPTGVENIVAGRRVFVKRENPADCNVAAQFSPAPPSPKAFALALDPPAGDSNVVVDLNVLRGGAPLGAGDVLLCDENVDVELSAYAKSFGRSAVDVALVLDKSGSMGNSGSYTANYGYVPDLSLSGGTKTSGVVRTASAGSLSGGTRECLFWFFFCWSWSYDNWVQVGAFAVDDQNAFDVNLTWTASSCGDQCPKLQVYHPGSGTRWGFQDDGSNDAPPGGTSYMGTSSTKYDRIYAPQSASINGAWEVWAWNDDPEIAYTLNIATFFESLAGWQPIGSFLIDDSGSTTGSDVRLSWSGACTTECPRFYIENDAGGERRGHYGGTPPSGTYAEGASSVYLRYPDIPDGNWTVFSWNDAPAMSADLNVFLRKIDAAQVAGSAFVNSAEWKGGDQLALLSYNSSTTTDQVLTADFPLVGTALGAVESSGGTGTEDAIRDAVDHLTQSAQQNPNAIKFAVLLSDGVSTYCPPYCSGSESCHDDCVPGVQDAANDAADANVVIYTIGLGDNIDADELSYVASATGGSFYYANGDVNQLSELYDLIAREIGLIAEQTSSPFIEDFSLSVPLVAGTLVDPDSVYTSTGSTDLSPSLLAFNAGNLATSPPWTGGFSFSVPCVNDAACQITQKTIPESGSQYAYTFEGAPYSFSLDLNAVDVNFYYRDLEVSFAKAELLDFNSIRLTTRVDNVGYLPSLGYPDTNIDAQLFWESQLAASPSYPGLCAPLSDAQCAPYFATRDHAFAYEGSFTLSIDANAARDCPANNTVSVVCRAQLLTGFYYVDYRTWFE